MKTYVLKWMFWDYVVFKHRFVLSAVVALLSGSLIRIGAKRIGLLMLMKADRAGPSTLSRRLVKKNIDNLVSLSLVRVEKSESSEFYEKRMIVLKDPVIENGVVVDKGVFLIKFTPMFGEVFNRLDTSIIQDYFTIVLEPSWSGYCLPEILVWASLKDKIIVQASDPSDRALLNLIDTNLKPVPFGSGDWVDESIFYKIENQTKEYDVICVSNFNSIKRPYILVKVLKRLLKRGVKLKAALVCAGWGDSRADILEYIKSEGGGIDLEIFESVSQSDLNILLNKSKVNILLSLKEGSNRSLFEGFFSGTPGIVLAENVGVNKEYFNEKTGACVAEKDLADTLVHFSMNWEKYDPLAWAQNNIAPEQTVKKLANAIGHFNGSEVVSYKITPKVNSPEAKLIKTVPAPSWSVNDILGKFCRQ